MRGLHHRDPGLVGGLLDVDELTCELITDGLHVHPAAARLVHRVKGPDRLVLITDTTIAAGMPDGAYEFGRISLSAEDASRCAAPALWPVAPSRWALRCATASRCSGVDVPEAVLMASTTPARVLGLEREIGAIAEGMAADFVVLGADLEVEATMVLGSWI
jgi:N-acetylglucosamine-6-phosphate deacetylase